MNDAKAQPVSAQLIVANLSEQLGRAYIGQAEAQRTIHALEQEIAQLRAQCDAPDVAPL